MAKEFYNKNRLRRSMLFLNVQRPSLLISPTIYGADSLIFDLEDAVAVNQKDSARFSLYNAMKSMDYGNTEIIVRINGLDTPFWEDDIRVSVASKVDGIRIPKCESKDDVLRVEEEIRKAEIDFNSSKTTLIMAAIESPVGLLNSYEIAKSSDRMFGIALSGGDMRRMLQVEVSNSGIELQYARGHIVMVARAAGIQCFDTVYTDISNHEGFIKEATLDKEIGFDGKSLIHPKQIELIHEIYMPSEKEIRRAERIIWAIKDNEEKGVGVFAIDGEMFDIAFLQGAKRTISLAKANGIYEGDL